MTDSKIYSPTTAQKKLLEKMLDPSNRYLSITALCELAKIRRMTYYRAFDNPKFVTYYKSKAKDLVSEAILPTIHAFAKAAKAGSFQHGKLLLEMADMHTDQKNIDLSSSDGTMTPRGLDAFYNDEADS